MDKILWIYEMKYAIKMVFRLITLTWDDSGGCLWFESVDFSMDFSFFYCGLKIDPLFCPKLSPSKKKAVSQTFKKKTLIYCHPFFLWTLGLTTKSVYVFHFHSIGKSALQALRNHNATGKRRISLSCHNICIKKSLILSTEPRKYSAKRGAQCTYRFKLTKYTRFC